MHTMPRAPTPCRPVRGANARAACAAVAWVGLVAVVSLAACAEELPADLRDYATRCVRMNAEPIGPTADDPHLGTKDVYACGVAEADLTTPEGGPLRDYPVGAVIIKESVADGASAPWLVAVADKRGGAWAWAEYTRNFDDEPFLRIPGGESVCTDCHQRARTTDWIFTRYTPPPEP